MKNKMITNIVGAISTILVLIGSALSILDSNFNISILPRWKELLFLILGFLSLGIILLYKVKNNEVKSEIGKKVLKVLAVFWIVTSSLMGLSLVLLS